MLIKNRKQIVLVVLMVMSLFSLYGFSPLSILNLLISPVAAASLDSAKDTLSDSSFNASSSHTIVFDLATTTGLTAGMFINLVFDPDFSVIDNANVFCPAQTTASTTDRVVDCIVDASGYLESTTTQTIVIYGVTNPGDDGARDVLITSYLANGVEDESSGMKVYIIDDVTVTATVDATLAFSVNLVAGDTYVNGIKTSAASTPTAMDFGNLSYTASTTVAQELRVTTNATNGYTVTVQQNHELQNAAGATINSFNNSPDGTGSTTHEAWDNPLGKLDHDMTYGHLGITSDDATFSSDANPFNVGLGAYYIGLNGAAPAAVMYHDGPADNTTQNKGMAKVAYSILISNLQEAGDYSNTLTYVCTPTY